MYEITHSVSATLGSLPFSAQVAVVLATLTFAGRIYEDIRRSLC